MCYNRRICEDILTLNYFAVRNQIFKYIINKNKCVQTISENCFCLKLNTTINYHKHKAVV